MKINLLNFTFFLLLVSFIFNPFVFLNAQKEGCNPDEIVPVSYGQKNENVKNVQFCLIELGYRIPAGATGYYGDQTTNAIKEFYNSLDITGRKGTVLGPQGVEGLRQKIKKKRGIQNLSTQNNSQINEQINKLWNELNYYLNNENLDLASKIEEVLNFFNKVQGLVTQGQKNITNDNNILQFITQIGLKQETNQKPSYEVGLFKNTNKVLSFQQTNDQGYILAGISNVMSKRINNLMLMKISSTSSIQWIKIFENTNIKDISILQLNDDDGYILAGTTNSFGVGGSDIIIIKTDINGNLSWVKTIGGKKDDSAVSFYQDGNDYILAGTTNSFGAGGNDIFLVKINNSGEPIWAVTVGAEGEDSLTAFKKTTDNGYILTGKVSSFGLSAISFSRIAVIKVNSDGIFEWGKLIGGSRFEEPSDIEILDNGYAIIGSSLSFGNDNDLILIKLDNSGNIVYAKNLDYGGFETAPSFRLIREIDDYFIISFYSSNLINPGIIISKIREDNPTSSLWTTKVNLITDDNKYLISKTNDNGYALVGKIFDRTTGNYNIVFIKLNQNGMCENCDLVNNASNLRITPINPIIDDLIWDVDYKEKNIKSYYYPSSTILYNNNFKNDRSEILTFKVSTSSVLTSFITLQNFSDYFGSTYICPK